MTTDVVHRSPFAGTWYPGERTALEDLLTELFEKSAQRTGSDQLPGPAGFVVPHAGLAYSGTVAAAVFRQVAASRPRRVILAGFSHRGSPPGAWIPEVAAYATPLGEIPVDRLATEALLDSGHFGALGEDAVCDHSVEIQLPLLQHASPESAVVPVYVSGLDPETRRGAAAALASLLDEETVLIASSDFTHYGQQFGYTPFPLDRYTGERLRTLDEGFIEAAGSVDSGLFTKTLREVSATVCGREPIALLLDTIRSLPGGEDYFQRTLDYQTSGELTGDFAHCVSYAALGYYPWSSFQLDREEQLLLLESARDTLAHYQRTGQALPVAPVRVTARMERKAGAFVTLRRDGELRGCVGRIAEIDPLAKVIPAMTLAAALEDTRFEPLRPEESGIEIEVSILSPMKRLPDPSRFRVGIDGGYLKVGGAAGLLLPQVADGRDWTAADFLAALAQKAHVPIEAFSNPAARLYIFRAQIIE